jgi:phosphatidylserine/phosphatidylglycerophosphate/cardiolipin synthase-like enzyme
VANAKYDARLFDILADKLMAGISVRIITSSPGAKLNLMNPYSNMKNFTEITDILLRKIQSRGKVDKAAAKRIIAGNLQLAPLRIAKDMDTWSDGKGIANHSKVISVDNAAFYIGSKNLYPATLQDFGFIVEDPKAAQEFKNQYLDIIWNYSREAAVVDYEQGICNF